MGISIANSLTKGGGGSSNVKPIGPRTRAKRDPFAPRYDLIIRGGVGAKPFSITDEVRTYIESVTYEDNVDQFDKLTIVLSAQADDLGGGDINSMLDSKVFAEGHIVEVRMGYGKALMTVGAAIIVKITPDFPDEGPPSITIVGYDLLYKTSRNSPRKGVRYHEFRDSQIASIIGSRNSFDIDAKRPDTFENIRKTKGLNKRTQKKGVNDYKFLKKVAEINGYDLYSRFDGKRGKFVLFFEPPPNTRNREVFTFFYGSGDLDDQIKLGRFTPTLDAADQATDFEMFVGANSKFAFQPIDRLDQAAQKRIKTAEERRYTGGKAGKKPANDDGIEVAFKAFGRSFKFPPYKRFKNEDAARRAIELFIKRQKENFITGEGALLRGHEAVQTRQILNFQGLTDHFSGKYFLTRVTHTTTRDAGYDTDFACRKIIDDVIVQSPPDFTLTSNDVKFRKAKGI